MVARKHHPERREARFTGHCIVPAAHVLVNNEYYSIRVNENLCFQVWNSVLNHMYNVSKKNEMF